MIFSRKLIRTAAIAGLALSVAVPGRASALALYGSVGNGSGPNRGDIIRIDQTNATANVVGNPTTSGGITGIDFDNNGNLWGSTLAGQGSTSSLIQIDRTDGSLVNTVGAITAVNGANAGSALSIGDLAYNRATNTLFGITSNAASPTSGGDIYTIDTGTGLASFVGSTIWDTNAGITFDDKGQLLALGYDPDVGPFGTNMLFMLDTADGSEIDRLTVSLNDFIFPGLGFDPSTGKIVAVERFTGNLYDLDASKGIGSFSGTGDMTLIGMPANTFVSDVAFGIPEPAGVAILAFGFISMAYSRRRRAP
ncbi:MAG: hypothetical protein ACPGRZ_11900 [Alphaproteobacteria bacterium]